MGTWKAANDERDERGKGRRRRRARRQGQGGNIDGWQVSNGLRHDRGVSSCSFSFVFGFSTFGKEICMLHEKKRGIKGR